MTEEEERLWKLRQIENLYRLYLDERANKANFHRDVGRILEENEDEQ